MIKLVDMHEYIKAETKQYFDEQASTAERLKIAKALQNLGNTSLDKRIYKKK